VISSTTLSPESKLVLYRSELFCIPEAQSRAEAGRTPSKARPRSCRCALFPARLLAYTNRAWSRSGTFLLTTCSKYSSDNADCWPSCRCAQDVGGLRCARLGRSDDAYREKLLMLTDQCRRRVCPCKEDRNSSTTNRGCHRRGTAERPAQRRHLGTWPSPQLSFR
jgi:hypothetical protein